jgi:hypothetical protein
VREPQYIVVSSGKNRVLQEAHNAKFMRTELFFNRHIAHLVNHMIAHSQYAKQQIMMVYKVHEPEITSTLVRLPRQNADIWNV